MFRIGTLCFCALVAVVVCFAGSFLAPTNAQPAAEVIQQKIPPMPKNEAPIKEDEWSILKSQQTGDGVFLIKGSMLVNVVGITNADYPALSVEFSSGGTIHVKAHLNPKTQIEGTLFRNSDVPWDRQKIRGHYRSTWNLMEGERPAWGATYFSGVFYTDGKSIYLSEEIDGKHVRTWQREGGEYLEKKS